MSRLLSHKAVRIAVALAPFATLAAIAADASALVNPSDIRLKRAIRRI